MTSLQFLNLFKSLMSSALNESITLSGHKARKQNKDCPSLNVYNLVNIIPSKATR